MNQCLQLLEKCVEHRGGNALAVGADTKSASPTQGM